MVWWATTVLGGDEPHNLLDLLEDAVGISPDGRWYDGTQTTQAAVEHYGADNYIRFIENCVPYDPKIAAQMVAVVHMACGVGMRSDLAELTLQGCRHGHLGWRQFSERQQSLGTFALLIQKFQAGQLSRLRSEQIKELIAVS